MTLRVHQRMDQTVTVYAHSGYNSVGDAQYSTSSATHAARVEKVQRLVKSAEGRETMATTVVYVSYTTAGVAPTVTVQSKITSPMGRVHRSWQSIPTGCGQEGRTIKPSTSDEVQHPRDRHQSFASRRSDQP